MLGVAREEGAFVFQTDGCNHAIFGLDGHLVFAKLRCYVARAFSGSHIQWQYGDLVEELA